MMFHLTLLGFSPRTFPILVELAAEAWGMTPKDLRIQIIYNQGIPVVDLPEGWTPPACLDLNDWTPGPTDGERLHGVMHEPAVSNVWEDVAHQTGLTFEDLGTVVHPTASVAPSAQLGPGTWVHAQATVATLSVLGPCCHVNRNASVGHHNVWGAFSRINPGAHTAGMCQIGSRVTIGIGAVCREGLHIGDGAIIGAGAVAIRDVAPGSTLVGNPAKPLK